MSEAAHILEIDLIPADYRSERALMRSIRVAGWIVLGVVCTAAALGGTLRHAASEALVEVERLRAAAALVDSQRLRIAGLEQRRSALQAKLSLLEGLRRPAAPDQVLLAVNGAVPADRVWFLEWRYRRLGAVVSAVPAGAEGYFVAGPEPGATGAVRAQVTIIGKALDHASVSGFVRELLGRQGIEDVQIRSVSREIGADVVNFEIVITTRSGRDMS